MIQGSILGLLGTHVGPTPIRLSRLGRAARRLEALGPAGLWLSRGEARARGFQRRSGPRGFYPNGVHELAVGERLEEGREARRPPSCCF